VTLPNGIESQPGASVPVVTRANGFFGVRLAREVFCLDALLRSAYRFTDRCHVFLESGDDDRFWLAVLRPKGEADADVLVGDFANDLIDQQLRMRLETQFGHLRTLMVAQAFSEGNLLDPSQIDGDPQTDPRAIAVSR
jgi:His-Xaa-Ser system protein HxsD